MHLLRFLYSLLLVFKTSNAFFLYASNDHYCRSECISSSNYEDDYYTCLTKHVPFRKCSPFKDTTYTGTPCRGNHHCAKHGEGYYWCYTDSDNNWDYCGTMINADKQMYVVSKTYKAVCVEDCRRHWGTSYNWCDTLKGWDYCDPNYEAYYGTFYLTRYGYRCAGDCKYYGKKGYYYCDLWAVARWKWDYCSKDPEATIYGKPCLKDHPCDKYGKNYYWCYTENFKKNWDYCSPQIDCGYWPTDRQSRGTREFCKIRDVHGRHITFTDEGGNNDFLWYQDRTLISIARQAIGRLEINGNYYEGGKILVRHKKVVRIKIEKVKGDEVRKAKILIERKFPKTKLAEVLVQNNGERIPTRYIRRALEHSLDKRTVVKISVDK